ncbi:DUF397 domain-containing protein [Actinokineospora sp.]|uniref:DUF397 domain-containing protein n=1 Tax=Actinokineospora sp. TaxID=1872133 RepID=UPI003D6B41F8
MDLAHAVWRKSSRSGGTNCVEIAWLKSSRSGGGDCVEIARLRGFFAVRDSKHPGGVLIFPEAAWVRVAVTASNS